MRSASSRLAVLLIFVATLTSCGRPPALPTDSAASFERITGTDSDDYLFGLSSYKWDDRGQAAGATFEWIAQDAQSSDNIAANQAGQAAHSVSKFLQLRREDLFKLSTGWFGWQTSTVGQFNPGLIRGIAIALAPYQGALVGDTNGIAESAIGNAGREDFPAARSVFAVINTDTEAGTKFTEEANNRVRNYLKQYAEASITDPAKSADPLIRAAALAGVISGGQRESGNTEIQVRSDQYWINWLNYELAVALGARPGNADIDRDYFTEDGTLMAPDDVPKAQQYFFSGALQNFAQRSGKADAGRHFRQLYKTAAGE